MRQFAARFEDFQARDVDLVRVFYSKVEALAPYAGGSMAAPFPVLADPGKQVYRKFGVGGSYLAMFKPSALQRVREARRERIPIRWKDALRDGFAGFPADFLIGPDGRLRMVHYGGDTGDSALPDTVMKWLDELPGAAPP